MAKFILVAGLALLLNAHLGSAYNLVCYFSNWAQYRPGPGHFTPDDIDPCLCTHLIYAFAGMQNNEITTIEWNDVEFYKAFNGLKNRNSKLKTLLAIGGWNFGSASEERHCEDIHLFYMYVSETNFKYACLVLQEIREAFEKEAKENNKPRLMITAAVAAGVSNIEAGYEIRELSQYLDQIHVMTYDLNGSWDGFTGENSSLYKYSTDTGSNAYFNVEYAMNSWKNNGVPAEKLIVGFPEYGHNFLLSNPSNNGIGAPTSGAGPAGPYTREAGFWAYYEICSFLRNGATEVWDASREVPYAYKGNEWVGYDNVRSFDVKTQWLKQNNFGGAMIWAIDLDDFTGLFCGQGKFPLTSTLNKALGVSTSCTTPDVPPEPVTSPPGSRSRRHNGCGCSGGCGFCAGKPDGLYPVAYDRHAFWHCSNGISYLKYCPDCLVFDPSCNCCNWP
ncbi:acidic mammalian chitinase-like [Alexandromys fortis]|uniref:acidic mammalian chitinase-like n=1 Tax=Alexandromys fortis TaxID=100897 RepID=UPI002152B534|nr:acidic mammalian chitinase-like [Microtus fortis]